MSEGRKVAELLVACTREHDWSEPDLRAARLSQDLPPERVVAAATYHRVVGCVLSSLQGSPLVPSDLLARLAAGARMASGRSVLAMATLRSVRSAFGDLPWLALKGPVLDAVLYPRPFLRSYVDLDVLVAPRQMQEAVSLLEAADYALADRNWQLIRETMASELHLQRLGGAPIDLHWTLVFRQDLRRTFRFRPADMIARARTVEIAGGPVRTFDPVDTLLHLTVHAALEGGDRLVWMKDVDVASRDAVDWAELVDRACAYGVRLPVATILARSTRILGAPVPEDVVPRLAPAAWRALTRAADSAFPAAASRGIGTPATLLARSARGDVSTTLRFAARGLGVRARALGSGRVRRIDHRGDPGHVTSLLHPAGDQADRDEYFAELADYHEG